MWTNSHQLYYNCRTFDSDKERFVSEISIFVMLCCMSLFLPERAKNGLRHPVSVYEDLALPKVCVNQRELNMEMTNNAAYGTYPSKTWSEKFVTK